MEFFMNDKEGCSRPPIVVSKTAKQSKIIIRLIYIAQGLPWRPCLQDVRGGPWPTHPVFSSWGIVAPLKWTTAKKIAQTTCSKFCDGWQLEWYQDWKLFKGGRQGYPGEFSQPGSDRHWNLRDCWHDAYASYRVLWGKNEYFFFVLPAYVRW